MALLETTRQLLEGLPPQALAALEYDWSIWGRPKQLEPAGEWDTWLLLCGRNFGKSLALMQRVRKGAPKAKQSMLIAATAGDLLNDLEGEGVGILRICPPGERPRHVPSKMRLEWPTGAITLLRSAEEPDRMRGPNTSELYIDELGAYRWAEEVWSNAHFTRRLPGVPNRTIVATTSKRRGRAHGIIKRLVKTAEADHSACMHAVPVGSPCEGCKGPAVALPVVIVTRGNSYENSVVSPSFRQTLALYENTTVGREEIYSEVLGEEEGALWTEKRLEANRRTRDRLPLMRRIVIAVDPGGSWKEDDGTQANRRGRDTGIIVAGLGKDGHMYVLADLSGPGDAPEWAKVVIGAYHKYSADRVVAEVNYGGKRVEEVLRAVDRNVSYKAVCASRGKLVRAEPVAALDEKGKVHLVGYFPKLEGECTSWTGDPDEESPNRVDALVWAGFELFGISDGPRGVGAGNLPT